MSLQDRGVFNYIVKDPGTVAQMSKVIMSSFLLGAFIYGMTNSAGQQAYSLTVPPGVLTILTLAATFFST